MHFFWRLTYQKESCLFLLRKIRKRSCPIGLKTKSQIRISTSELRHLMEKTNKINAVVDSIRTQYRTMTIDYRTPETTQSTPHAWSNCFDMDRVKDFFARRSIKNCLIFFSYNLRHFVAIFSRIYVQNFRSENIRTFILA